ncbi:MAG: GTPase ObgE [Turneriella sp.]|nr:GTPase ObgE [Turneriella sp.]
MHKFVDEVLIRVQAGKGGAGEISFLREKFIEFGGPDGGDGGDGGDVIFTTSEQLLALSHIRPEQVYRARNGFPGEGSNCNGKKGADLVIRVPFGTQLIDPVSGALLHDFTEAGEFVAAKGGRGGKGNAFFRTAKRQAPRFAQPGEETEEREVLLSLKMIADVGLVGFPNAGKSTLLKALTKANPKIANYPFTTLSPNIGVIEDLLPRPLIVADIPGILEGASKGYGLGLSFLKHIERVRLIVFVIDLENAYVETELGILKTEIESYSKELLKKPSLLVLNKIDRFDDKKFLKEFIQSFKKQKLDPIPLSAQTGEGMPKLRSELARLLRAALKTLPATKKKSKTPAPRLKKPVKPAAKKKSLVKKTAKKSLAAKKKKIPKEK